MSGLRPSQVETLREIDALEGEASVAELAGRLGKSGPTVEGRLLRLLDREVPLVTWRFEGPSWACAAVYSLTPAGREAAK